MAARRCVPSQSRHFDQSLCTDRRPPFWNSARRLPETVPAGKGSPAPSPRVLQMKSSSLCFWLFSSSLFLCDPSCAYFACLWVERPNTHMVELYAFRISGLKLFHG